MNFRGTGDGLSDETAIMNLSSILSLFNRKECYWLLREALGSEQTAELSIAFRRKISATIPVEIPSDAWWAIDYHIDWLFAAIAVDRGLMPEQSSTRENPTTGQFLDGLPKRAIRGTQEDFDFIIAFERTIILIEAKGVGTWSNTQIARKCQRLQELPLLLGTTEDALSNDTTMPTIFVVLLSPNAPKLKSTMWPAFVQAGVNKLPHMTLNMTDAPSSFLAPERFDGKKANKLGEQWRIRRSNRADLETS
jgi:hypothetical protein